MTELVTIRHAIIADFNAFLASVIVSPFVLPLWLHHLIISGIIHMPYAY